MNIVYQERARQGGGDNLLEQSTKKLAEILSLSQEPIMAEWDRIEDESGCPRYVLHLRDFSEEEKAVFTPEDLRDPNRYSDRLYRLVGDLLKKVSDQQHRKVLELVGRL